LVTRTCGALFSTHCIKQQQLCFLSSLNIELSHPFKLKLVHNSNDIDFQPAVSFIPNEENPCCCRSLPSDGATMRSDRTPNPKDLKSHLRVRSHRYSSRTIPMHISSSSPARSLMPACMNRLEKPGGRTKKEKRSMTWNIPRQVLE
jgi:hypothetical protein